MRGDVPKYVAIKGILLARMERELTPGSRVPSEAELCADFGVSRATVQQALRLLESAGCIRREQGRGTFYVGRSMPRTEQRPSELLESLIKHRDGAMTKVVHKQVRTPPAVVADRLGISADSEIVYLERIGIVEGEPIVFIRTFLPYDLGQKVLSDEHDLERMTIATLLEDKHGIRIASVRQTISATLADPSFAEYLDIDIGSPVLEGQRIYFDQSERPIFCTITFYRADRHCFVVTLKDWR
ncbi:MAG: GntR family transcriptional regulator [Bradyrhizobiaceae bacterium]|nr:GntR family transcriptional regulator [Bradyrhizobiaceae bacterium]